jgi:hypothetical protein
MISILISALVGYYAHRKFKPISDKFPVGWDVISNYSAGGVLIILLYSLFYVELRKMPHGWQRSILALVLDFFGVGGGTAVAWLYDTIMDNEKAVKDPPHKVGLSGG